MGLRGRLLASFFLVLLIPLIALGVLAPLVYTSSFEQEINGHTRQMIEQTSREIDDTITALGESMAWFQTGPAVQAFFGGADRSTAHDDLVHDLDRFRSVKDRTIAGLALVSPDGRFLGVGLSPVTRASLTQEPWFQAAVASPDRVLLFSRPIGRNLRSDRALSSDDIVSVVRSHAGGVMVLDLRVAQIERLFDSRALAPSGFLFIVDGQGNTVYSPVNALVYRILPSWFEGSTTLFVHAFGGVDYQILSRQSAATGWRTIGVFSLAEALKEAQTLRIYALVSAFAALVLAFVSSLVLTSGFVRPIVTLQKLMKRVEEGDLNVHFETRGGDEVSRLGAGFNTMIEEIRVLIEEVAAVQQAKREAELQVLQEQIKPHFLYNTLDTIHWMAQERGAKDISAVVAALTKLFRIGLSRGKETISLAEEADHVRSYLFIQKVRYEDKFDYAVEIPEELHDVRVLRLILQPLVENAIYHGLKPKRGTGFLSVTARRDGEALILSVTDDGVGLNPERLTALNTALAEGRRAGDGPGYGVFNGAERLRLSFGRLYGLRFLVRPEGGTLVEIRHPLMEDEEGGSDALESLDR